MLSRIEPATGPEIRMTATPARPCPLDSAKMVGCAGIAATVLVLFVLLQRAGSAIIAGGHSEKVQSMSENRLAHEVSPYLLQHKDNPVHWWAWGSEALA